MTLAHIAASPYLNLSVVALLAIFHLLQLGLRAATRRSTSGAAARRHFALTLLAVICLLAATVSLQLTAAN